MKKRNYLLITFLLIFLLGLSGCKKTSLIAKEYKAESEIRRIEFSEISGEIEIIKDSSIDNILIKYNEDEKLYYFDINLEKGVLSFERKEKPHFFGSGFVQESTTIISIPENYDCELKIVTASGEIEANGLELSKISLKSTNGEISISNITSKNVELENRSGEFEIENVNVESLNINGTNGEIEINNSTFSSLEIKTTNGEIEFLNVTADKINVESSNSEVNLKRIEVNNLINIKTLTGSINVSFVGRQSRYFVAATTNTGKVTGATKEGEVKGYFSTSVGSVNISYQA